MSFAELSGGDRRRISVTVEGTVQGVGFRPFVHELARSLGLAGSVRNESGTVLIQIEGQGERLRDFLSQLERRPPRLARIEKVEWKPEPTAGETAFRIEASRQTLGPEGGNEILISPDIATCDECLAELLDPEDRRFGYPFLNCVSCGPRFTIIEGVPYDRDRTTMRAFALCEPCRAEYEDPDDRRFHAQPVACEDCGPRLSLRDPSGKELPSAEPLTEAARALEQGRIVAVKGLGGYHLACDARSSEAVSTLRARKRRDEKALAIMVSDLEQARALCEIGQAEAELLQSMARPIVLLSRRGDAPIAPEVSLRSPHCGVMLPYTPLHHLLLRAVHPAPLVMTSGNETDRPIAFEDRDALERLHGIADLFLVHDRPIRVRCDDSVARIMPEGETHFIRRSRGYAPGAIRLPEPLAAQVLAVGGQLKNTFALGSGAFARMSHHVGDLDDALAFDAFEKEIVRYEALFGIRPRVVAHDLHPDYLSTRYAEERARRQGLRLLGVQHHHAHMASCMAENRLTRAVIGVSFDGTGYGLDGRIWGGEFLVGDAARFERAAHLAYVPMPGGEQAIREPWRMALAHLLRAKIDPEEIGPCISRATISFLSRMIEQELSSPLTSSIGRLFDAVASLLGARAQVHYEGQAAVELEWLASKAPEAEDDGEKYEFAYGRQASDAPLIIDPAPLIAQVVASRRTGVPGPVIAMRFHRAVARMIVRSCGEIRDRTGLSDVTLSGGVFMNALLLRESLSRLRERGFRPHYHRLVPANDGGISLGQLAVAAARIE